jgi:acyl homoserine lactone synthase
MECLTFSMARMHLHGRAFYDFLRLRKRFFVDHLGWDIPHDDEVEMDQYDNPRAHYSVVLRDGEVVGGARCMPTSAVWGQHTYMLGDAANGRLTSIPAEVMGDSVNDDAVWECTRLVVSERLTRQAERSECLSLIVEGLVEVSRHHGARELICLSTLTLMRALRQLGYAAERRGGQYFNDGDRRHYAVLAMPALPAMPHLPRPTHRTPERAMHAPSIA